MHIDDLIGKQLGDFVVLERIGQGGMATVYRSQQQSMKRDVALKVINFSEEVEIVDFRRRFDNEAALIASLEHLRVLPVHDYGIEGEYAYLAMRYLRGGSLKDMLRQEKKLTMEQTAWMFEQIASGLAYAHSKGIVHRDLKPANIMLDESHNAYLTDFGLAKIIHGNSQDVTQSGHIVGTVTYMAPEQLRGDTLDHRADIYSLGVILYEISTGTTPFGKESNSDIITLIYKHLEDQPEAPSKIDANFPPQLEKVILKALSKRPDQRYQTVGEMAEAVSTAIGGPGITSTDFPNVSRLLADRAKVTDSIVRARTRVRHMNNDPRLVASLLILVVIVILGLLAMFSGSFPLFPQTVTIPEHSVLEDETITGDQVKPTEEQIKLAQTKLGTDGFIGVIACNLSSEYHATLNREIRTYLDEYGLKSRVYDSDSDTYEQIPLLERAMAEGADGLILCPLDMSLLDAPLQTVESRHMPLAILAGADKLYGGVQLSSQNSNYDMGFAVGEFAGEIVTAEMDGEAQVIILDFPDMDIIVERANGLEEGILSSAPEATIVGRYLGATQENAYQSVTDLIADEVQFDVILSINDAGSYGAIQALEEAGITADQVFIASVDAERQAMDYITEGNYIRGSLSVGRQETAQAAVDIITQMLAGASVAQDIQVLSGEVITAETLAESE